ncbi:imidazole glycerol phosphate synthase subunit HisH [Methylobacterium sp. 77]|uniref:imidazole glycerol phosphate synthase subunit HisH n=1 Tax=Methylobacterium sp. 77 TaxID=1101192 RepID=UPI00036EC8B3|nr:imidazole glycerol phosphate synthase subunit HisH [Methylobacterium sp. 77]
MSETVAIIDYGSGNLHSAAKAFERAGKEAGLSTTRIVVTSDPDVVASADRVVLPGVGAYADCRQGLDSVAGMVEAMTHAAHGRGRPFLGICVGMQLLASRGLEYETTPGLGWIAGDVGPIRPSDPHLKVPHMGWNTLRPEREHALLDGIPTGETGLHAYFVHSFALAPVNREDVVAESDYGGPVTAFVARDNVAGTQFHPEKSQHLGLALIANFLRWRP